MSGITILFIGLSILYLLLLIVAKLRIRELSKAYDNLLLINNNLSKTFPELDKLILLTTKRSDEDRIKLFKIERDTNAPDITDGEVQEVIIAAKNETEVVHLLGKTRGFVDDGWWTISVLEKASIVKISYLKTL